MLPPQYTYIFYAPSLLRGTQPVRTREMVKSSTYAPWPCHHKLLQVVEFDGRRSEGDESAVSFVRGRACLYHKTFPSPMTSTFMISSLTGQVRILFTSTCTLRILLARKGQDLDEKTLICTHKPVSWHILSGMTFIDIYDLSISSLSVSNRNSFISWIKKHALHAGSGALLMATYFDD